MILVLILYMLLASTFTIGKAALAYVQPIFLVGLRMFIAGTLFFGYIWFFRRHWFRYEKKDFWLFLQIVIFHIYGAYVLEFVALQQVSSIKACLIYSAAPFMTAFVAYFWLNEYLTRHQLLGLFIGSFGILPVLFSSSASESGFSLVFISLPEMLLLGSVAASVQGWIAMKRLVKDRGYEPLLVNAVGMFIGGGLALGTSLLLEAEPFIHPQPHAFVFTLVYTGLLIVIANGIFYNLYGYLLRTYSATFLSLVGVTTPLFAVLYGHLFLAEAVTVSFVFSIMLTTLGVYLFYQHEIGQ